MIAQRDTQSSTLAPLLPELAENPPYPIVCEQEGAGGIVETLLDRQALKSDAPVVQQVLHLPERGE